ncbi:MULTISPECIES: HNH endonuclease [Lysinibacillus]|uniref:HNH endonuclease n=1 Tax=Lysinibacillus TaxID=400634 RepID=UPI00214C4B9F|nr:MULTISPECIES: HNH endonuclease [Lysinibacillus]UUV25958.1 HNH endonuclease [Lysinibacillus sp. FN11]UYB48831.1 HNH endonuclease [Lysinibacillus capsici]
MTISYHRECKDCAKKRTAAWVKNNPEKRKEYIKRDNAKENSKLRRKKKNTEYLNDGTFKKWQMNNKDKLTSYRLKRQQHKTHTITNEEWKVCKEFFNNKCAYCGLHIDNHFNRYGGELKWSDFHKEHVDHNGSNGIENCVPSCKMCNSNKWTYKLEEWYNDGNEIYDKSRQDKIYKWLNNFNTENT